MPVYPDISAGGETVPIPLYGGLGDFVQYVTDSVLPNGTPLTEVDCPPDSSELTVEGDREWTVQVSQDQVVRSNEDEEDVVDYEEGEESISCDCHSRGEWTCTSSSQCDCVSSFGNFYSTPTSLQSVGRKHGILSKQELPGDQVLLLDALPPNLPLVECGPKCGCGEWCANRVSQRGVRTKLSVQPTPTQGLGLFYTPKVHLSSTINNTSPSDSVKLIDPVNRLDSVSQILPKGTFIALYAGEYLTSLQAHTRWASRTHSTSYRCPETSQASLDILDILVDELPTKGDLNETTLSQEETTLSQGRTISSLNETPTMTNDNYILSIRLPNQTWHIDPRRIGNVSRYMNHSCDPNCIIEIVFWGSGNVWPRAGVYTRRDIQPGEQLTFDYSSASSTTPLVPPTSSIPSSHPSNTPVSSYKLGEMDKRVKCMCQSFKCKGWIPFDPTL
ncbi:hypothetical protein M231_03012 [Tremella mesenterica]|uniref:SET domain-containing protein n=1 Tax=Tremella mesenterica TaxID=5217 RepID=A0A4Q1BP56_TREME|nr:uncharacterized protein TREMEDRAFT_74707 [Tremella mesenterica DSM 1558]EIW66477.1 hypothetical protein TREMEDRAFT_74707 [Tremella mesenterica DSM 1558]RXK39658.1 hypothetical protein M231_03012 [Tremella mesenterica]